MIKRKALFVVTIAILILPLLAACSGGSSNNNGNTPPAEVDTEGAAGEEGSEPEPEKPSDEAVAEESRSFDTVKGNVDIPVRPLRVVTDFYGGELLAVDGNVVGVEPSAFRNPFLAGRLKNAEDVGDPINVEKVLELQPDLIVVMYDQSYEALSKIAPTLHIPYGTTSDVYEVVTLFGDIVGKPDKAEQFIVQFDQKAEEGREKLEGIIDENATFGLYELTDKGDLWMFGDNAGRGGQPIYNALQLQSPAMFDTDEQTLKLSMEVLPDYAADYMFLTTYDPENKGEAIKELRESKVWEGLDAVRNNTVFYNDFDTFYRYDPIAIYEQIDLFVDMIIERNQENKN